MLVDEPWRSTPRPADRRKLPMGNFRASHWFCLRIPGEGRSWASGVSGLGAAESLRHHDKNRPRNVNLLAFDVPRRPEPANGCGVSSSCPWAICVQVVESRTGSRHILVALLPWPSPAVPDLVGRHRTSKSASACLTLTAAGGPRRSPRVEARAGRRRPQRAALAGRRAGDARRSAASLDTRKPPRS